MTHVFWWNLTVTDYPECFVALWPGLALSTRGDYGVMWDEFAGTVCFLLVQVTCHACLALSNCANNNFIFVNMKQNVTNGRNYADYFIPYTYYIL